MAQPTNLFPQPFADSGDKNIIPVSSATSGAATLPAGFPPITSLPLEAGGVAPTRQDFNGVLYMLSAIACWTQAGGLWAYSATTNYEPPCFTSQNGALYWCKSANGPSGTVKAPASDTAGTYWVMLMDAQGMLNTALLNIATPSTYGTVKASTTAAAGVAPLGDSNGALSGWAATESKVGATRLATSAETQAGTAATIAVTPAGLASRTATADRSGIIEIATTAETTTGTDATRAVSPAGLKGSLSTLVAPATATTYGTVKASTTAAAGVAPLGDSNGALSGWAATESKVGATRLATSAETQTGTAATIAVTPAGLASRTATADRSGIIEIATTAEAATGTDTTRAVTPAGLAAGSAAALAGFQTIPDNIIGIELTASNAGMGRWRRIDKNAKTVMPQPGYFASHPVYADIGIVQTDGQSMVIIPKFYFLHKLVDGKHRWWISKTSFSIGGSNASVHKGFIYNGVTKDSFQVGAFECSADANDAGKAASKGGTSPLASIDFPTMVTRCAARNTGTVTGFGLWNIYQLAAIQMLALIEMGGPDAQNIIGTGNDAWQCGNVGCKSGTTNAEWRGIYELWGNVWHMVQGLENRSGAYYIWADAGNSNFSSMSIAVPGSSWVTEISSAAADQGLFLPSATGASTNNILADSFWSNNEQTRVCYHGGSWDGGAGDGLFCLHLGILSSSAHSDRGGRLARVG